LGVTISPILRGENEVTGAICLLSDLTELAALQTQIHMKENLAALGELSAGIAHEFKNALATISGYAQMIRSEAKPGTELREHGEKILDQTRALTHVVTEFLKFARPLDLADEQVTLRPLLDRILAEVSEALQECRDVRGRVRRRIRRRSPSPSGPLEPREKCGRGRRRQSRRRARDHPG